MLPVAVVALAMLKAPVPPLRIKFFPTSRLTSLNASIIAAFGVANMESPVPPCRIKFPPIFRYIGVGVELVIPETMLAAVDSTIEPIPR